MENETKFIEKERFNIRIKTKTMNLINDTYKSANCTTKNEFIENAIEFYCGYLAQKENANYFSNIVTSTVKAIVEESQTKMSRIIFKQAVELATLENLIAAREKIDEYTLNRLRGKCVEEVKRINGQFDFTDAMLWQHGDF